MPAYNFEAQFADAVTSGRKRQTIRRKRRRPTRVGDTLYLYTGMRTPACRKLREEICTQVLDIVIDEDRIALDGAEMLGWEQRALAQDDGFDSVEAFRAFFRDHYDLPFEGVVIAWLRPGDEA